MNKRTKHKFYWAKANEFKTFARMKEWAYFHLKNGDSIRAEEVDEDGVITKIYRIERADRKVNIIKVRDFEKEAYEKAKENLLSLFD